jgi:hypothetical protein
MLKLLAGVGISLGLTLASRLLQRKRPKDQGRQTSDWSGSVYGANLDLVYGIAVVSEKVIYKSSIKNSSKGKGRRKGKRGSSKTRVSAVVAVCRGPVSRVTKIWFNNKLVYIDTPYANRNYISSNCDRWQIYTGQSTQAIDNLVNSAYPSNQKTSYPGICYVVFEGLGVGDLGDELPNMRFEVENYQTPFLGNPTLPVPLQPPEAPAIPAASGLPPVGYVFPWNSYHPYPSYPYVFGAPSNRFDRVEVAPSTPVPPSVGVEVAGYPYIRPDCTVNTITGSGGSNCVFIYPNEISLAVPSGAQLQWIDFDFPVIHKRQFNSTFSHAAYLAIEQGLDVWVFTPSNSGQPEYDQAASQSKWDRGVPNDDYAVHSTLFSTPRLPFVYSEASDWQNLFTGAPGLGGFDVSQPFRIGFQFFQSGSALEYDGFWLYEQLGGAEFVCKLVVPTVYPHPSVVAIGGDSYPPTGILTYQAPNSYRTIHLINNLDTKFRSPWYCATNDGLAIRVTQTQDGLPILIPVPSLDVSEAVIGAYLEYRTVPEANLAGDTPVDNEGRLVLWVYNRTTQSYSDVPITPYQQTLGVWHYRGNLIPVQERATSLQIAPMVNLLYTGRDNGYDFDLGQGIVSIEPTLPNIDYFAAPNTQLVSGGSNYAGYARALCLGEIVAYFCRLHPKLAEVFAEGALDAGHPDLDPNPSTARIREIYGYRVSENLNLWREIIELYNLFTIDLSDTGGGEMTAIAPEDATPTIEIPTEWLVRGSDDSTGELQETWRLQSPSFGDLPSEVRIQFRDIGRDAEESLARYHDPTRFDSHKVETISTNATMAFVTCQALCRRHLDRAMSRAGTYTLRISRQGFGAFSVGDRLRIYLPSHSPVTDGTIGAPGGQPVGWVSNAPVTLLVDEIELDEQLVSTVQCRLSDEIGTVATLPLPPVTQYVDDLPAILELEAQSIPLPILGEPVPLRRVFVARAPSSVPVTGLIPATIYSEVAPNPETVINQDGAGLKGRDWSITLSSPITELIPGTRARNLTATLAGDTNVDPGWQTYTQLAFDQGSGNLFWIGGRIYRFRTATLSSNVWTFGDAIVGLAGTHEPTPGAIDMPLVLDQTYGELLEGVYQQPRQLRAAALLQLPSSSPQIPFAADGEQPYKPTQLLIHQQPSGVFAVTWHGHRRGQGFRVGGRHPVGYAAAVNYRLTYQYNAGVPVVMAGLSTESYTVPAKPPGTTSLTVTVQQMGQQSADSPIASRTVAVV